MIGRRTAGRKPPLLDGRGQARLVLNCVLVLFFVFLAVPALAQQALPPLTGRVVDAADLLQPADEAALAQKLEAHEARTTDQVVIATVPSLGGTSVEDYANRRFRAWRLGQDHKDNGVLLLVAPNERKVRIEVGYGLEGALTDALSGVIVRTAIAPRFAQGDFAGGLNAGVDAILAVLTGDAEEWQRRAEVRAEERTPIDPLLVLLIFLVLFYVATRFMGGGRGGPGRQHRTRGGRWIVLPTPVPMGGGWSGGGGGFSGGGGSSGGGGASGSW